MLFGHDALRLDQRPRGKAGFIKDQSKTDAVLPLPTQFFRLRVNKPLSRDRFLAASRAAAGGNLAGCVHVATRKSYGGDPEFTLAMTLRNIRGDCDSGRLNRGAASRRDQLDDMKGRTV